MEHSISLADEVIRVAPTFRWARALIHSVGLKADATKRFSIESTGFAGKNMATGLESSPGVPGADQKRVRSVEEGMPGHRQGRARLRHCVRRHESRENFASDAGACRQRDRAEVTRDEPSSGEFRFASSLSESASSPSSSRTSLERKSGLSRSGNG